MYDIWDLLKRGFILFLMFSAFTPASGATFHVSTTHDVVLATDSVLSLREAIAAAQDRPGPDTIRLPAGYFRLNTPEGGEGFGSFGDLVISDPFHALTIQGPEDGEAVLDGNRAGRVFDIGSNSIVVLNRLVIFNGRVYSVFAGNNG
ncbi:MAG: hypothetical protein AAF492_03790, partial [Verrucomicrobiota bacterium]